MKSNNKVVSVGNEIITGSYKLGILEQRLILMIIAGEVNDKYNTNKKSITDNELYTVSKKQYIEAFGNVNNNELIESVRELVKARIEYTTLDGKKHIINWLQEAMYDDNEVKLRFSKPILPLINELEKNFTSFSFKDIVKLRSSYSVRIFQLAASSVWRGGTTSFTLDEFKYTLGILGEYEIYGNLKKDIITRCTDDINQAQDTLRIEFVEKKIGRKVIGLMLKVVSKRKMSKDTKELEKEHEELGVSNIISGVNGRVGRRNVSGGRKTPNV